MRAPNLIRFARLLSSIIWSAGFSFLCSIEAQTTGQDLDYRVGDQARETIRATERIRISDPEKNPDAFSDVRSRIPPIFGYSKESVAATKTAFEQSWRATREDLLSSLERVFGKRELRAVETSSEAFSNFIDTFQSANKGFPLTDDQARRWAMGNPAENLLKQHLSRLETFSTAYFIRSDEAPDLPSSTPTEVDLITLADNTSPTLEEFQDMPFAKLTYRQFIPVSQARQLFQKQSDLASRSVKAYLSLFIQANTRYMEALSIERWDDEQKAIQHEIVFEAGDVIVRAGEPITPVIKEALDIMAVNLRFSRLKDSVKIELAKEPGPSTTDTKTESPPPAPPPPARQETNEPIQKPSREEKPEGKLPPALSPVTVADAGSKQPTKRAEPAIAANPTPTPGSTIDSFYLWIIGLGLAALAGFLVFLHYRKGPAVYIHEDQTPALVSDDRQHLMKALTSQLTQTLFRQRQTLLRSKEEATAQVAAMEDRLAKLQPEIFDKLQAYETKIKELEERLQEQGVSLDSLDRPLVEEDPEDKAYTLFSDLKGAVEGEDKMKVTNLRSSHEPEEKEVPFPGNLDAEDRENEIPTELMNEVREDLAVEDDLNKRIARGSEH